MIILYYLQNSLMDFGHQRKEGSMDWVKELKEQVGVADEGFAADLNDVEGREYLTAQHLDLFWQTANKEITENVDVTVTDSTV